MKHLDLSLRQRRLLNYLQQKHTFTTGLELATYLHVSDRTIRNDVLVINSSLVSMGIRIVSKRRWGYILEADDHSLLTKLNQSNNSFLSREERIRYILFRLCLSDEPVSLYDLEDEMFISHTTLEHDLASLRKTYFLAQASQPYIAFSRYKNTIFIERDEWKRRLLLVRLFAENWNYNKRGNTFYQYQYLEEPVVDLIIHEINQSITHFHIIMDDVNMVSLDLTIAIAYYRITSGYHLSKTSLPNFSDALSVQASDMFIDAIEGKLECSFSSTERQYIYTFVSCSRLLDADKLNFSTVGKYFSLKLLDFASCYIQQIQQTYHLDFSENEDFYITILQLLRYLALPVHNFNLVDSHQGIVHSQLLIEFEIAFSIQPLALEFYGYYLDYTELLYLAFCISGALEYKNRTSPKIRTVILCHLNLPAQWRLKHQILNVYHDSIELTRLLPVYIKDTFDFSNTDLIISTANKAIAESYNCETITISALLTEEDLLKINHFIKQKQILYLYQNQHFPSLSSLLEQGSWHEQVELETFLPVIELLYADLKSQNAIGQDFLENVLQRESIISFAFQSSVALVYSLKASYKTQLAIATLDHRIKWNGNKIRTVIMASIAPDSSTLIFKLINELYYGSFSLYDTRFLKTKDAWLAFLKTPSDSVSL